MAKCFRCGQELQPGEIDCSLYATGKPTRDHKVGRMGMHVFEPYVDEHISVDGQPVLVTSESHRRQLMRNRWRGDNLARIEPRQPSDESRYRTRHWRDYVESKKERSC